MLQIQGLETFTIDTQSQDSILKWQKNHRGFWKSSFCNTWNTRNDSIHKCQKEETE